MTDNERDACDECDGIGAIIDAPSFGECHTYEETCPRCGGTGRLVREPPGEMSYPDTGDEPE